MTNDLSDMIEACKAVILVGVMALDSRTSDDVHSNSALTFEHLERIERAIDGVRNAFSNGTGNTLIARLKGKLAYVDEEDFAFAVQAVETTFPNAESGFPRR